MQMTGYRQDRILASYLNGGYRVSISDTGCKVRTLVDPSNPYPVHPETFDLKVTDWCNAGCAFCHEGSTTRGKHGELEPLLNMISTLPKGVEIAIGGGDPLSWPHLDRFLEAIQGRYIANITVNGLHINKYASRLRVLQDRQMIYGIGISAVTDGIEASDFKYTPEWGLKHVVGHVILGRYAVDRYYHIPAYTMPAYLFLGYKNWGRGVSYKDREYSPIPHNLESLCKNPYKFLHCMKWLGVNLSFDNLAIKQLRLKEILSADMWSKLYMGDDGKFSMYVDAVKQEFAQTSTSGERVSWSDMSLTEYFQKMSRNL